MASRTSILEHVIEPERPGLAQDLARYVLSLGFPPSDQARYGELAERAQEGALTPDEKAELDDFLSVNDFLTIVQAKARISLANGSAT